MSVPVGRPAGSGPFQFESKGRKRLMSPQASSGRRNPLFHSEGSAFWVYSGLPLIDRGPPTLARAVYFPQSTDPNVDLIQKTPSQTR